MTQIACGQIVRSKAGRDQGRLFIVVDAKDDNYALVVDGTLRKLAKPKRKKLKHLEITPHVLTALKDKFETGRQVFDAEIKSSLEQYKSSANKEGTIV